MHNTPCSVPFFGQALAEVLKNIKYWVELEGKLRIVVATSTQQELKNQKLPEHIIVEANQPLGKRVILRGARNNQQRLKAARYPESQMDEATLPLLLCVASGQAKIYAGDYILTCQPGDFVFIPPNVPKADYISHAINDRPETICKVLYFYPGRLFGKGLESWVAHSEGKNVYTKPEYGVGLLYNHFTAELFAQIAHEVSNDPQSEVSYLLMQSLIAFMLKEINDGNVVIPELRKLDIVPEQNHDPIQYALTYLESNIGKTLTIEKMSRLTTLSPTVFKQLFKEKTGVPFYRYLTDLRLELAKKILSDSDMKIHEIAGIIGLSPSRFNRNFNEKYFCSPSAFRKKVRK